jgi:hypothetical protein
LELLEEAGLVGAEVRQELGLPLEDLGDGNVVEVTVDTSEDEGNHLVDGHGLVLLLLEKLGETLTTVEGLLGGSVQVGTELGEGGDLTVLGQEELQGTSDLLHGLELSGGADTRHRQTDVDGGADTLVEELGLQEDLTVGDGNDVGGNVSGDITTLGLNDGKGGKGSTTELVVHLGGTLKETRVEVEDTNLLLVERILGSDFAQNLLAGVGLTSRRTAEEERHLTVGDGLLGQIVVHDNGVLSIITEPFTHGGTGEGSDVLERSGLGGGGGDNDGVLHGVVLLKSLDELGDGGSLLTNGDVDAVKLLGLVLAVVPPLLVEHGVESDGSLTSLTVTNDQLTLTTADGNHGVDRLKTSLYGLVDGVTGENTGGLLLGTALLGGLDGTLAVNGVSEGVNDATKELNADGDVDLNVLLVSCGD